MSGIDGLIKTLKNHMRLFNHLQILYPVNVLVLKATILLLLQGIIRCWEIQILRTKTGSVAKEAIADAQLVLCLAWKDDGMIVFLEGCDKHVKIWPLTSGGQPVIVAIHDL
ncbi:hypothetical protein MKW92_053560 [Papaver armeniacum]|nr:hypothetical protein MKW92_053560 [Papaver armeniacum]